MERGGGTVHDEWAGGIAGSTGLATVLLRPSPPRRIMPKHSKSPFEVTSEVISESASG